MLTKHTLCFPRPDVHRLPLPWGDPHPEYPRWPALPPWVQPVYAPEWRRVPDIWA